jgi:lysophospholipase L1-like esterase
MKFRFCLVLSILMVSFGISVRAENVSKPNPAEIVVDTFETYADSLDLRPQWNFDGDVTGLALDRIEPCSGSGSIRIDYRQAGNYYGSGYRSLPQLNVTGKNYLAFCFRGTTGIAAIQLQSDDSGARSEYSKPIPASSAWSVANVPLDYFSGDAPADPGCLIRVKFFLENKMAGSLFLDNIAFTDSPVQSPNEFQVCEPESSGWEPDLRAFEHQDRMAPPAPGQILFLGSSSIRLWDLEKSFPALDALNRGFGGSHVLDSLQYAERLVFPYRPRKMVFYAGDNDIASGKSPESVLRDYQDFVTKVHKELPELPIVYISIKTSPARWEFAEKMRETNRLIQAFSEADKRLEFLDVDTPMMGPDRKPRAEYFSADGLHLSSEGYALWTSLLRPYLM